MVEASGASAGAVGARGYSNGGLSVTAPNGSVSLNNGAVIGNYGGVVAPAASKRVGFVPGGGPIVYRRVSSEAVRSGSTAPHGSAVHSEGHSMNNMGTSARLCPPSRECVEQEGRIFPPQPLPAVPSRQDALYNMLTNRACLREVHHLEQDGAGGAGSAGGGGSVHHNHNVNNFSLNEAINGFLRRRLHGNVNTSSNVNFSKINVNNSNNSVQRQHSSEGLDAMTNPSYGITDSHDHPNTRYNNSHHAPPMDPNTVITRNTSNNSSTSSSHPSNNNSSTNSSLPSNSNCHGNNRQAGGNRSQATEQPSSGSAPPVIQGILRQSGSGRQHQQPGCSQGEGENNEKVVRIDPSFYDSRDLSPARDQQLHVPGAPRPQGAQHPQENINNTAIGTSRLRDRTLGSLRDLAGDSYRRDPALGPSEEIQCAPEVALSPGEELRRAAAIGDLGKLQTLLGKPPGNAAGAALVNQLDETGSSSLLRAAAEGRVGALRLLLRHGANVDHQDKQHGNTALHEASWKGYSASVAVLLRARAALTLRNRGGFTPLHLACQNGHNQTCRLLLLAGADPDVKNACGDTPLHTAARYGHAGVTRILLSARAAVHHTNEYGDSCLHIAAAMGRRKLTRILLEAGAVQTGTNMRRETPQDIARRKEFPQILAILQDPPPVVTPEERLRKEREAGKKGRREAAKTDKGEKRGKTNGSGTSSKDSSTRAKEKKKQKSEHKDRRRRCGGGVHWSPYGCHNYPPPADLPPNATNPEDLPKDGLKAGEQYYIDLAGNIKKGPVAVGTPCYCAPLFKSVENKLESDKVALMDHIDAHHEKLGRRIYSLEKRTDTHIHRLRETVEQKITEEKQECLQRSRDRTLQLTEQSRGLQRWVEQRLAAHDPALPPTLRRGALGRAGGRDPVTGLFPLTRSRSEEALTEVTAEAAAPCYKGLRVLDHPTSMYNLHQTADDDEGAAVLYDSPKPTAPSEATSPSETRSDTGEERVRPAAVEGPDEGPHTAAAVTEAEEHQRSLNLMQDSSDSEGEEEDHVTDQPNYYARHSSDPTNCDLQQGVGKLRLNHPYYTNTGAIPKGSLSSIHSNTNTLSSQVKEVITVDVHDQSESAGSHKWSCYNRYDPRNNKRYLYDVQEVEPSYGDVAPEACGDGRARDSGCSDGSSQTEIADHLELPKTDANYEPSTEINDASTSIAQLHNPLSGNCNNPYLERQSYSSAEVNDQQCYEPDTQFTKIPRSNTNSFSEPHHQIQQQQQLHIQQKQHIIYQKQQYQLQQQQQFINEGDPQKPGPLGIEHEAATYLDMDRYRIQQAVRRLYDGYNRLEVASGSRGRTGAAGLLESSLEHDSHNDSGYSTRMCTSSQGPSPALSAASGAPDGSGSESRSGHSTSSPSNTVIAFPRHPSQSKAPLTSADPHCYRQDGGASSCGRQNGGDGSCGRQNGGDGSCGRQNGGSDSSCSRENLDMNQTSASVVPDEMNLDASNRAYFDQNTNVEQSPYCTPQQYCTDPQTGHTYYISTGQQQHMSTHLQQRQQHSVTLSSHHQRQRHNLASSAASTHNSYTPSGCNAVPGQHYQQHNNTSNGYYSHYSNSAESSRHPGPRRTPLGVAMRAVYSSAAHAPVLDTAGPAHGSYVPGGAQLLDVITVGESSLV